MPDMTRWTRVAILAASAVLLLSRSPLDAARQAPGIPRSVYISAVDAAGAFVDDLTPADLAVKESGRAREITKLERATEQAHVAIVVDDGGEGHLQLPTVQLLTAAAPRAVFAINMLNPQSIRLNDFTGSGELLQRSVARLVQRGRVPRDWTVLADAVSDASRDFRKRQLGRPVIVVLTNGGDAVENEIASPILDELRKSAAGLHLIHLVGADLGMVFVEGPPRSGGSVRSAVGTAGCGAAATAVADTLAHQYKLTYFLPSGVRPGSQLQVTTTRAKVKITAPTRIPDDY
jgi:hypothetical protein